jgi:hypothetical protein
MEQSREINVAVTLSLAAGVRPMSWRWAMLISEFLGKKIV